MLLENSQKHYSHYNTGCSLTATLSLLILGGYETEMFKRHYGFGSDGASVMTGHLGGAEKYKRHNPRTISIHCMPQTVVVLNGCVSEGTEFRGGLHSVYNHFGPSVKRREGLAIAQQ